MLLYKSLPWAITLALVLASCSSSNPPASEEESNVAKDIITVSGKMSAKLPVVQVVLQLTNHLVLLSGRIEFDPNKVTRVYSLVTGVVNHIDVDPGAVVRKGQVLAEVNSTDIANAVSDFQKSRDHHEAAQKALVRMRALFESKLVSQSDLEQTESEESQAHADYDRSLNALKLLGGNERTTSMTFKIDAPIDGTVVERLTQPGSQVRSDGSLALFTIGSTESIWVTLDAYPENLRSLHVGDSVVLKAAGLEDRPFTSRIDYISPTVDPTSFTTKVRCTLPNSESLLKPGMFVSATVYHPDGPGLYIPSAAAFYDNDGKVYVFLKTGTRSFRKQQIQIGQAEADRIQVMNGLSQNDSVVANNALFLNDELQADQK